MPYITDIELDGMVKTARKLVVTALEVRFGVVPAEINERLEAIEDLDVLEGLHRQCEKLHQVVFMFY